MKKTLPGPVEIISLTDAEIDLPLQAAFPDIRAEQWSTYRQTDLAQPLTGEESLHVRIGAYLVRSPEYVILVDTGLGLYATTPIPTSSPAGLARFFSGVPVRLLEELRAAGVKPDDVDLVFLTHAHSDHYGWTLTAEGEPLFPHARYLLSRTDWEAFRQPAIPARLRWGLEHFVSPLMERGVLNLIADEQRLFKDIRAVATHGHTPGHQSLLIDTGSKQVLIGGDIFVHPLQISDSTVCFIADMDQAQTIATRNRVREWIERDGILFAANHIPGSGFGHIVRDANRYLWRTAE